jgi:D-alanine-D-alanine ligase
MKIGIFFGGPSREREVSFAGGRTVYDNLDKSLFEAIPIFVDSYGNFILLDWQYLYKGTIRDFYPPIESVKWQGKSSQFQVYVESLGELSESEHQALASKVGKMIHAHEFKQYFDFAFLALHGQQGEDGSIQGLLEWYGIPYSGSGIFPSAIGINKIVQSDILRAAGFARPRQVQFDYAKWQKSDKEVLLDILSNKLGLPLVIKSPNQGSSIGVSILRQKDVRLFEDLTNKSFFVKEVTAQEWLSYSIFQKKDWLVRFTDIREGLGFPVEIQQPEEQLSYTLYRPEELLEFFDRYFTATSSSLLLKAQNTENTVLFESFLEGKEFSCIVIRDESGKAFALPPTEIIKYNDLFDYRSKYLPGTSRKITPIDVGIATLHQIREDCVRLFEVIRGNVYARIDGFITIEGKVFLNDPNTTSGMMPSSFFFHQAAEIGLDASSFLTYLVRTSLIERIESGKNQAFTHQLLNKLEQDMEKVRKQESQKIEVAVIMGGFSSERHISMESGRNIYEKLASSTKYRPFPVFLTGDETQHELYLLPLNFMLKDNADDIKEKIYKTLRDTKKPQSEQLLIAIREEAKAFTQRYTEERITQPTPISYQGLAELAEVVFIALHGRPGEDGALQQELEKVKLPYNGSGVASSQTTINKYITNEILAEHGIKVANHSLVHRDEWNKDEESLLDKIEKNFTYPLIGKPSDDGCSSAVKKIKNRQELRAFTRMMFRPSLSFLEKESQILRLKAQEEFPQKNFFLIEELIDKKDALYFLEITGGLLTHFEGGEIRYEIFEPSETLALGEVLSLEEKFLAGEGQNITPARYALEPELNTLISQKVKEELGKVAKVLHIEGYARIDAFVKVRANKEIEIIIIEVNSLPGMTPATCIFHQCALNGYKPYHFIDAILNFAQQRFKHYQNISHKEEKP